MIIIPGVALVVPFLLSLGLTALSAGWPAMIGLGFAGAGVLLIVLFAVAPGNRLLVLLALGGPVALVAVGQTLVQRQGSRRGPLIVTGFCLTAILPLMPILPRAA